MKIVCCFYNNPNQRGDQELEGAKSELWKAGGSENEKTPANSGVAAVVRAGIEPATHGFSVHCSTY